MKTLAIISLAIFVGFIVISVLRFGLQESYSAFSPKWDEKVPIHNMHLWSIVTFVVAFLLMIPMIDMGGGSPWQFLGFFAPLYLFTVAIFPLEDIKPDDTEKDIAEKKKKRTIHTVAAACCSVAAICWVILVEHLWWVMLICAALCAAAAYFTKTLKSSLVFWSEMAAFSTVYSILIFA